MKLMRPRPPLGRGTTFAAACLLVLTLGGCGGGRGGDDKQGESSPNPSASQSTTPPAATTSPGIESSAESPGGSEGTAQSSPSAGTPKETAALLRAGRTGLRQVPNSTVYSIESENEGDTWEVEVVTSDGTKHEMYISSDGKSVARPPRTDGKKAEYRERIQGAKLDFQEAVDVILGEVPGARFKELGLDHEKGTIVWEADVVNQSGTARSLEIDAASGKVVKNKLDT